MADGTAAAVLLSMPQPIGPVRVNSGYCAGSGAGGGARTAATGGRWWRRVPGCRWRGGGGVAVEAAADRSRLVLYQGKSCT